MLKLKRGVMRAVALMTAITLLLLSLTACSGTNSGTEKETDAGSSDKGNTLTEGIELVEKEPVEFTRDNLDEYQTPEWWRDAKFGIFIHYGVYSVPAYGDEWYGHWMYMPGSKTYFGASDIYTHHLDTYGGVTEFGYKDFIPDFIDALKVGTENNMAETWAQLFYDAGAKYVMPVGMHHDSMALYDSDVQTTYNTVNLAGVDYIANLQEAVKAKGMKFGISNHFAENDWFFDDAYAAGTDIADEAYSELYGTGGNKTESHVRKWYDISMEIIEKYHPDIVYYDVDLVDPAFDRYADANRYLMLANYYNMAQNWEGNEGVVVNYKNGAYLQSQAVLDSERSVLNGINPTPWQTDTTIGSYSWGYITNEVYRTSEEFIGTLIDIVSKNGNFLLNVGPRPDGTIPDESKQVLLDMGDFLKTYGDAIYATRPWLVYGEGTTQTTYNNYSYTGKDIRFTRSKDMTKLYVSALGAPSNDTLSVTTLKKGDWDADRIDKVSLMQGDERIELEWQQTENALDITLPQDVEITTAYSVEITFKDGGMIPSLVMDASDLMQAYDFEDAAGLGLSVSKEDGTDTIINLEDGAYAKYLLDFDKNDTHFMADISGESEGTISVYIDSPDSDPILTLKVEKAGADYRRVTGLPTNTLEGVHSLYIKLDGSIELSWFKFTREKNINTVIEAEDYDTKYGAVQAEPCSDEGSEGENLGFVQNNSGNYVMYSSVDFGENASTLYMRLAGSGQSCNVRIDSVDGEVIANTGAISTGGWTTYNTFAYDISGVSGVHDVYITYDTGFSELNINWFAFSDGSYVPDSFKLNPDSNEKALNVKFGAEFFDGKQGNVQAEACPDEEGAENIGFVAIGDWVKYSGFDFGDGADHVTMRLSGLGGATVEIRLDSRDGELLASFSPTTGAWTNYSTFESDLSSTVTGKHDIYLVFSNSVNVNWFTFSKAN